MNIEIIGGGIGGLTLAATLERVGLEYSLFEQSPNLRTTGFAITIHSNALHALRSIGLEEAIRNKGNAISCLRIATPRGRVLSEMHSDMIALHRADLQATLASAVPATRLHFDARIVESEKMTWIAAAEGVHSLFRQAVVGDELPPRSAGYTAWRGMSSPGAIEIPVSMQTTAVEFWGTGMRFGIVPLLNRQVYWFAVLQEDVASQACATDSKSFLSTQFSDWQSPILDLIDTTSDDTILKTPIYDRLPIKSWYRERILLLGDAAHPMTPNLGQGGCQAIEDAVVLGYLFGACRDGRLTESSLGSCYESLRKPRVDRIVKQSYRVGMLGNLNNPLLTRIRNLAMILTPETLHQRSMRELLTFTEPFVCY
ncbi:FAD-dependent monooxygenase [Bythopirellula polymerisocia]|uniref:FAD-dependent urate hydroxylase n=1 Tax=Bythopirellula polymerisocia TaxID=2528003 RepID=A0A5C6D455_9BACT|nr:FAD-dependent monooxygenase [Bythopirellula polymerisocia]TWU30447.1 FAD-dependent urate hydroxylase [Bythopirellula polymerisocia]